VADGDRGLLSVDPNGAVTVRATEAGGLRFGLADDVDAAGGKVYFSDASWRHGKDQLLRDTLEARPHGRLLEYDPASGETRALLGDLDFANGVAVAPDGRFVLVAETFRYRVRRYWLAGPDAGHDEVFADNLPGFPDGVSSAGDGTFWLALYTVRNRLLERVLHPRPWLKRLIARLPRAVASRTQPYGLVLALDGDGNVLRSLHDPGGERVRRVTSVEARDGYLYLGSVEGDAIARVRS
jgi:sugar lactone lactonase YvrE